MSDQIKLHDNSISARDLMDFIRPQDHPRTVMNEKLSWTTDLASCHSLSHRLGALPLSVTACNSHCLLPRSKQLSSGIGCRVYLNDHHGPGPRNDVYAVAQQAVVASLF